MPYVQRSPEGKISSVFTREEAGATEWLEPGAPELVSFALACLSIPGANSELPLLDIGEIRILEDLIETLIQRRVILLTDLPLAAQQKLANKKSARSRYLSQHEIMDTENNIL